MPGMLVKSVGIRAKINKYMTLKELLQSIDIEDVLPIINKRYNNSEYPFTQEDRIRISYKELCEMEITNPDSNEEYEPTHKEWQLAIEKQILNKIDKIETEWQYELAVKRVEQLLPLVDDNTPQDNENFIELKRLSDIVSDYSEEHFSLD